MAARFTSNERRILRSLLNNSRASDSEIASEIHISSQAIGKIRKKFESSIIKSYSMKLDYLQFGINTFCFAVTTIIPEEGFDEHSLQNLDHIITMFRIPQGSNRYLILFGFRDIIELDSFFSSFKKTYRALEIDEMFTFSHKSIIKDDPTELFLKTIDEKT